MEARLVVLYIVTGTLVALVAAASVVAAIIGVLGAFGMLRYTRCSNCDHLSIGDARTSCFYCRHPHMTHPFALLHHP
jgi:hypothetical protein